jgi:hypothetical protein
MVAASKVSDDTALPSRIAQTREQLIRFVDQFGALAQKQKQKTLKHLVVAVFNILLFGWILFFGTEFPTWLAGLIVVLVSVPAALVFLVYGSFEAVADLPETVRAMGATLNDVAARMVRDRTADQLELGVESGLLARLGRGVSLLRYLASIGGQVSGVSEIISGLMFMVNPIFPVLMLIGIASAWMLALAGLIVLALV